MHLKLSIFISNSTIITDSSIILCSVGLRDASDAMVECALWALYCVYLKLAIILSNSTVGWRKTLLSDISKMSPSRRTKEDEEDKTSKKIGLMPSLVIRFLIGLFFRLFWFERVIFLDLYLGSATIKR